MLFKKLATVGLCVCTLAAYAVPAYANRYVTMTLTYDYTAHKYNAEEVFVSVNGKRLTDLQMPPIIMNNNTLIPAREVFEAAGCKVDWKKETEQVYVSKGDDLVVVSIDSKTAYVNGEAKELVTPAKIINNKTMLPLRFVAEALGYNVNWDKATREAQIYDDEHKPSTATDTAEPTTEVTTQAVAVAPTTVAQPTTQVVITEATTTAPTTEKAAEPTTKKVQITQSQTQEPVKNVNTSGNMGYDANKQIFFIKNVNHKISPKYIAHSDDYNNLKYSLVLNGDYTSIFSNETYAANTDKVGNITVNVDSSKTTVTFYEKQIIALDVQEDGGYIYFRPVLPKEKYDKIIVLDAGHGGNDPGASGMGLIEKNLTLAILNKTRALFDADDSIKCYATRTSDTYPSFDDRTNLGNGVGDAFISIHINAASNSTASGTETYSLYPNDQGNGLTSYMLAERILHKLLDNLGTENRNVKSESWIVLRQSEVPATLIEIGFITNASDAKIMGSDEGQSKAAQAIYDSVKELFEEHPPVR